MSNPTDDTSALSAAVRATDEDAARAGAQEWLDGNVTKQVEKIADYLDDLAETVRQHGRYSDKNMVAQRIVQEILSTLPILAISPLLEAARVAEEHRKAGQ